MSQKSNNINTAGLVSDCIPDNIVMPDIIRVPEYETAGRFPLHMHLDAFGLIYMNGRMYDPYVGRFLSVDPVIQFPGNALSYNGYGYCLNNPLKYTDPSGMVMKAYDENDAALDAYFSWSCDRNMNFSYMGGPGGGGGGGNPCEGADQNYVASYLYDSNKKFYGYTYYDGVYYSRYTGRSVSWGEVYNNYVVPNASKDPKDLAEILKKLNDKAVRAITKDDNGVFGRNGKNIGSPIINFLGVKGLIAINFYWYSKNASLDGRGGVVIELSYSSDDPKEDYLWIQRYSENGGPWTYDNIDINGASTGSLGYYSPTELAKHKSIDGFTISFSDTPRSTVIGDNFSFQLGLYKSSTPVFWIFYGYTISNSSTTTISYPSVIYP